MAHKSKIAEKLAEALLQSKASDKEELETGLEDQNDDTSDEENTNSTADASDSVKAEGSTEADNSADEDTNDSNEADSDSGKDDNEATASDDLMSQALATVEDLSSRLATSQGKVASKVTELASAKADNDELKVKVSEAEATSKSLKAMASQLLDVYATRLSEKPVDTTNMSTDDILKEFTSMESKFSEAFPDSQTSEASTDADVDLGHSQAAHPISYANRKINS